MSPWSDRNRTWYLQLQMFDSDPVAPSYEAKCVLLSQQIDYSHVSDGQFCWPFAISPPDASFSSSHASSATNSSLGHLWSSAHRAGNNQRFRLTVTICRRQWLNRNIGFVIAQVFSCHERRAYFILSCQNEPEYILRLPSRPLDAVVARLVPTPPNRFST